VWIVGRKKEIVTIKKKILNWLDKIFLRKDDKQDYCTCSPDVLFGVDIGKCCAAHDKQYHLKNITKQEADIQFREDIKTTFNEANKHFIGIIVAFIYYNVVKSGVIE